MSERRPSFDSWARQHPHERFEGGETWASYLEAKVFTELEHGRPFLMVQRLIASKLLRSHLNSRTERPVLEVKYYLGWLAKSGILFCKPEDSFGNVTIHTSRFLEFPPVTQYDLGISGKPVLTIYWNKVYHTPLKEPFDPPSEYRMHTMSMDMVRAFDVAVGVEAMETLCCREGEFRKNLVGWYVQSALALDIPLQSEAMLDSLLRQKQRVLVQLLTKHFAILQGPESHTLKAKYRSEIRLLIETAFKLHMHNDPALITVAGVRFVTKETVADFLCLYPPK